MILASLPPQPITRETINYIWPGIPSQEKGKCKLQRQGINFSRGAPLFAFSLNRTERKGGAQLDTTPQSLWVNVVESLLGTKAQISRG